MQTLQPVALIDDLQEFNINDKDYNWPVMGFYFVKSMYPSSLCQLAATVQCWRLHNG